MSFPSMRALIAAALVIAAVPGNASAHLVSTGMGPLYDGALHFAMSPEAILPVAALAIFAGLRGLTHVRAVLLTLPIAWLLFGLAGVFTEPLFISSAFESVPLIVLGGLAAANPPVGVWVTSLLALMLGMIEGYVFGGNNYGSREGVVSILATGPVVFVLAAFAAAAASTTRWDWTRIAMRVAGSWIAASGLLLLGWGLR